MAGRYDNPIPTRFLANIDCARISAQVVFLSQTGDSIVELPILLHLIRTRVPHIRGRSVSHGSQRVLDNTSFRLSSSYSLIALSHIYCTGEVLFGQCERNLLLWENTYHSTGCQRKNKNSQKSILGYRKVYNHRINVSQKRRNYRH
jgi:hypothetical protein